MSYNDTQCCRHSCFDCLLDTQSAVKSTDGDSQTVQPSEGDEQTSEEDEQTSEGDEQTSEGEEESAGSEMSGVTLSRTLKMILLTNMKI